MKKLVASDIDGTLLRDGKNRIDGSFLNLIKELKKMGVIFVPASGRQLPSLRMLFEEVDKDMVYIAENGALITKNDEIISEKTLSRSLVHEIVRDIIKTKECDPILSTKDVVYISQQCDDYLRSKHSELVYSTKVAHDFFAVEEKVLKITACNYNGISEYATQFAKNWSKFAEITMSSPAYCDFMFPSVSKGNALELVIKKYGLTPDDCIAFGDHHNDISMFEKVDYSFVMSDADDEIKSRARFETDSVEKTLRKIFNL